MRRAGIAAAVVVLAGCGSGEAPSGAPSKAGSRLKPGKTRVLTRRIAYLVSERRVHPGSILAITFTNKAAAEMRGDTVHQQEEARFALHIKNDAKNALRLAGENWKVQREPRDAQIFLEAALAA